MYCNPTLANFNCGGPCSSLGTWTWMVLGTRNCGMPALDLSQVFLVKLQALTRQGLEQHARYFDLPSNIVCRVVNVQLLAEPETDEVYAQLSLLPNFIEFVCLSFVPFSDQHGEFASRDPPVPVPSSNVLSLCMTLAASDTGTNSVLSISGMDAGYVPASRISRNGFAQVEYKNYVALVEIRSFEVFILQMNQDVMYSPADGVSVGDDGKLRVGVRRHVGQQTSRPSSIISSESMYLGLLATASYAILRGTMFTIFYKPRFYVFLFVLCIFYVIRYIVFDILVYHGHLQLFDYGLLALMY
ncbi:hypothetical protein JRO89_XS02G0274600 [Xanthoceras sorbifolium]|uniref:Uncharacterized protein n=1 Tax=Xanthoceras sorbifolium TaxID=99658 RepID=A0ABQ8IH47_9ROSI|nr:hypothetical protein JRO89_XS02G0274600 [Xanthoceras sorbifolium]